MLSPTDMEIERRAGEMPHEVLRCTHVGAAAGIGVVAAEEARATRPQG